MTPTPSHVFEDGLCYGCGKRYISRVGVFTAESRCRACAAPICRICWQGKHEFCAEHRAPEAAPAPVAPRAEAPPEAVTRQVARDREESFLARVERSTLAQRSFFHPADGCAYAHDDRVGRKAELGAEEVRRLIRASTAPHPRDTFAEMPLNRAFVYTVSSRTLLGRRTVRVVVAGACVSPLAELVDQGWSARPMEFHDAAAVIARTAVDPAVFHYFAFFSPTGWSAEARRCTAGAANSLVALVELRGRTWTLLRGDDARWTHAPELFALNTEEEQAELVGEFVRAHAFELLMGSLTDRFVAERLGFDVAAVRRGFEAACRADPFVRGEITAEGYRLTREY